MNMSHTNTKESLQNLLKEPNDVLVGVDMDGVICVGEWWGLHHEDPKPNHDMITFMWDLYKKGAHLIVYTARQPTYYPETHAWLIKNRVPFHGIAMTMKPGADVYIDDKAIHLDDISKWL